MSGPAHGDTSSEEGAYVTPSSLAAAQWRALLARDTRAAGRRVLAGCEVLTYRAFAMGLWSAYRRPGDPLLLAPGQSRALWQRIVAESTEGSELLGTGAVRLAEEAWRLAAAYRIDPSSGERRGTADSTAFARWADSYHERLEGEGWLDDALLDRRLARRASSRKPIVTMASFEPTPAQAAVFARLESSGTRVRRRGAPAAAAGRTFTLRCTDPKEEVCAAAEWAASAAARAPHECFALVVPELGERAQQVRRVVADALTAIAGAETAARLYVAGGRSNADEQPLLGAALDALELLTPSASFGTASRWLRSPFFQDEADSGAAAVLEARLRGTPLALIPFLDAYRHAGLRRELHAVLPDAGRRLDAALELLPADGARPPARWAALWARALEILGGDSWRRSRRALAAGHKLLEDAWVELARLTPITGALSQTAALAALESVMRRAAPVVLPLAGVHVLAELEDVGPGYAGVWVTGTTDERLPRPVRLNPFLLRGEQVRAGVPWSTPQDALERSQALVAGISTLSPTVIFSWPARVRDEAAAPSSLITGLDAADGLDGSGRRMPQAALGRGHQSAFIATPADRDGRARTGRRRREIIDDPAPPLADAYLRGGAAALRAHAACPMRAFCEHRLGARPLVPLERGLRASAQGRLLHVALEHFFRRFDSSAALESAPRTVRDAEIERAARAAAVSVIGRGHVLLDVLTDLECDRAAAALTVYVGKELERAPFAIDALELETVVSVGDKKLTLRIDRIDALPHGGLAVLDYKTGGASRPPDWLGDRLRDPQLPLYAAAIPAERLSGLVVASVRPSRADYFGVWTPSDSFPGRRAVRDEITPAELAAAWRDRIQTLVDEYATGDVRIFTDDADAAAGAYAPLTRAYEQLASVKGRRR